MDDETMTDEMRRLYEETDEMMDLM